MEKLKNNIFWYYLFQSFREPALWGPVVMIYLHSVSGMSFGSLMIMEAVVVVVIMLLQIPTGAFADLVGRKKAVLLGLLLDVAAVGIFAAAKSPVAVWIADLTWAIGYSLMSGADTSLLYDSLKALGRTQEYKKIQGRSTAVMLCVFAIGSLVGAWVYTINIRLPLLLGLILTMISVFATFKFVEPPRQKSEHRQGSFNLMKLSVIFVANNIKVKWIIGFVVLLQVVGKVWFMTYNPYFILTQLPVVWYGWIFFSLNIVAAIFSAFADGINKKITSKRIVDGLVVSTGVPMFLMGAVVNPFMCGMVLFQNIGRVVVSPFTEHLMHDELDSGKRATVMSVKGAAISLGNAVMLFSIGMILDAENVSVALLVLGALTLIPGFLLMRSFRRIF